MKTKPQKTQMSADKNMWKKITAWGVVFVFAFEQAAWTGEGGEGRGTPEVRQQQEVISTSQPAGVLRAVETKAKEAIGHRNEIDGARGVVQGIVGPEEAKEKMLEPSISVIEPKEEKEIDYLKNQGLHYGRSPFETMRNLFTTRGQAAPNIEHIGTPLILSDMLAGVLTENTRGELKDKTWKEVERVAKEAVARAAEEAQRAREAEAQEAARRAAEAQAAAKKKAEEEAWKKAEEGARLKAEAEAKRAAEKAAEEKAAVEKLAAEEAAKEARRNAGEEARRAEEQRKADEAKAEANRIAVQAEKERQAKQTRIDTAKSEALSKKKEPEQTYEDMHKVLKGPNIDDKGGLRAANTQKIVWASTATETVEDLQKQKETVETDYKNKEKPYTDNMKKIEDRGKDVETHEAYTTRPQLAEIEAKIEKRRAQDAEEAKRKAAEAEVEAKKKAAAEKAAAEKMAVEKLAAEEAAAEEAAAEARKGARLKAEAEAKWKAAEAEVEAKKKAAAEKAAAEKMAVEKLAVEKLAAKEAAAEARKGARLKAEAEAKWKAAEAEVEAKKKAAAEKAAEEAREEAARVAKEAAARAAEEAAIVARHRGEGIWEKKSRNLKSVLTMDYSSSVGNQMPISIKMGTHVSKLNSDYRQHYSFEIPFSESSLRRRPIHRMDAPATEAIPLRGGFALSKKGLLRPFGARYDSYGMGMWIIPIGISYRMRSLATTLWEAQSNIAWKPKWLLRALNYLKESIERR